MPFYEYKCQDCGHKFEELRKMSEMDDGIACPKCGSNNTKRELSAFCTGGGTTTQPSGGCGG